MRPVGSDRRIQVVATYARSSTAMSDRPEICRIVGLDRTKAGPVTLCRQRDGRVSVGRPDGKTVSAGDLLEDDLAPVVGLFAPPLLLLAAVAAGLEPRLRGLIRRHERGLLGFDIGEVLAAGSAAVTVLGNRDRLEEVDWSSTSALQVIGRTVEPADERWIRRVHTESR